MKQNHFRIFGVRSIASSRLRNGNFLKSPTNTSCQLFRCLWLKGLICGVLTLYISKHVGLLCLESSFNCSLTRGCKSHLTELSSSCYRLFYRNGGRGNTSRRRPCHFTFWIWRPAWWLTSTSMWWIWQGRLSLGQLRPLTWTNLFSTLCSNFDMNTFWTDTINDEERGAGGGGDACIVDSSASILKENTSFLII